VSLGLVFYNPLSNILTVRFVAKGGLSIFEITTGDEQSGLFIMITCFLSNGTLSF
jgi:hypothetical protein